MLVYRNGSSLIMVPDTNANSFTPFYKSCFLVHYYCYRTILKYYLRGTKYQHIIIKNLAKTNGRLFILDTVNQDVTRTEVFPGYYYVESVFCSMQIFFGDTDNYSKYQGVKNFTLVARMQKIVALS